MQNLKLKLIRLLFPKPIGLATDTYLMRYLRTSHFTFLACLVLILSNLFYLFFFAQYQISMIVPRIVFATILIVAYPIFLRFQKFSTARFLLTIALPLAIFYGPLLSRNFGLEFFIRGPYQPILCLLITLFVLHPIKDRKLFIIAVLIHIPFTLFTQEIGEYFIAGSSKNIHQGFVTSLKIGPFFFYLFALAIGVKVMVEKEKAYEQLHNLNLKLLDSIRGNETFLNQLKKQQGQTHNKIQQILDRNSHEFRLPVSNLLGLLNIIEMQKTSGEVLLSDEMIKHLKYSIESLDETIHGINDELDKV